MTKRSADPPPPEPGSGSRGTSEGANQIAFTAKPPPPKKGDRRRTSQAGDGEESNAFALGARAVGECGGEMSPAGTWIAQEQAVVLGIKILVAHRFEDEGVVDTGLGTEAKGAERLEDGELGSRDPAFDGPSLAVQQFAFSHAQREETDGRKPSSDTRHHATLSSIMLLR